MFVFEQMRIIFVIVNLLTNSFICNFLITIHSLTLNSGHMKSFTIPMKIFLWPIGLIVYMSLTTCDLTKNDETPEEKHCQSQTESKTYFMMGTYQRTYFCYNEGEYVILRYMSPDIKGVCTSKSIYPAAYSIYLSTNQTKPIQVVFRFWWNTTSPTYSQEVPLEKTTTDGGYYRFKDYGQYYDISGYFPSGSAATINLSVEFKFISSGDNITDQDYLKSVFGGFSTNLRWYPY